jgi:hypothetical protein
MPEDLLSGWSKVAVKINRATCVMEAMRAVTLDVWEWGMILTRVSVAGLMLGVLLAAMTWMYRRQTA